MKSIYQPLLLLLLTICSQSVISQNKITIIGTLCDATTRKPIQDATVTTTKTATSTDSKGNYRITVSSEADTLRFSFIGYETLFRKIPKTQSSPLRINCYLHEKENPLSEIVVTGTRTEKRMLNSPVITHVISAKQIENRGVSDIRHLLMQEVPGLQFQEVGFGASIDMQGMSGKHILFLIDGERMTGEIGNNIDYRRIPLNSIERIEVVQGASSALYGSQAMGGVINIITKRNKKRFSVETGVKYTQPYQKNFTAYDENEKEQLFKRSLDYQNIDANISMGAKWKALSSYTNIKYASSDGYQLFDTDSLVKRFSTPDTVIHTSLNNLPTSMSGYQTINLTQRLEYDFSKKLSASVKGGYYQSDKHDFNPDFTFEQDVNYNLLATVRYKINRQSKLMLSANIDQYNRNNRFELVPDKNEKFYGSTLIQPRMLYQITIGKHSAIAGVEHTMSALYGYQFSDTGYETKRQYSTTILVQDDWQMSEDVSLTGGLRTDFNKIFGTYFTPKLSLLYKPLPFTLRLNYAHGYRVPDLKDLYMNWDHLGMFRIFGNKDLKPESNHYFSVATEYINTVFYANVMVYANQFQNKIEGEWRKNQTELHYINKKADILAGINLNMRIKPAKNLFVHTAVNYLHPPKEKGIRLTALSTWSANGRIEYQLNYARQQTVLNLLARYIGKKEFNVLEEFEYRQRKVQAYYPVAYPHYVVCDITATQRIGNHLRCTLGVNNLFNYKATMITFNSYVSPGRKAFIALSYTL